jgi:transposase-like protein
MAKIPTVRKRRTQAQREKLLQAYHNSQLSQAEFAAQAGISLSTLQLWLRKAATSPPAHSTAFVQVPNLLAQTPTVPTYRLHLAGGIQLEVSAGFEPEELAVLLQLLRAP